MSNESEKYSHHCSVNCPHCGGLLTIQTAQKKTLDDHRESRLKLAGKVILKWEGGYVNDPDDRGGATNKGVTYATYQNLAHSVLKVYPTKKHFESLSDNEVLKIIAWYYDKVKGDHLKSGAVAVGITDYYWGSGLYAIKRIQSALNIHYSRNLSVDGVVGAKTVQAINSVPAKHMLSILKEVRAQHYAAIVRHDASQGKFINGWNNRNYDVFNSLIEYV